MIHTISPGRASHIILAALRDVITLHKLEHGWVPDIPMEDAAVRRYGDVMVRHPLRLSPNRLHKIINEHKGLHPDDGYGGRIGPEGYPTGASFSYQTCISRLLKAGLIHKRNRWCDDNGGKYLPDYTITPLGLRALEYLDSNAYFILWRD